MKLRSLLHRILLIGTLCLAQLTIHAQTDAATQTLPVVLLPMLHETSATLQTSFAGNFDDALLGSLEQNPLLTIQKIPVDLLAPDYQSSVFSAKLNPVQTALQAGAAAGARFVCISMMSNPVNDVVSLYSWILDVRSGKQLAFAASSGFLDLTIAVKGKENGQMLAQMLTEKGLSALVATFSARNRSFTQTITFTSKLNGMQVKLANGQDLGTVEDNKLAVSEPVLEIGQELVLDLSKSGFYPARKTYKLVDKNQVIDIGDLYPKHAYQLGLAWQSNPASNFGADFTGFFGDEWLFYNLNLNLYFRVFTTSSRGSDVTHLTFFPELSAGIGTYFLFPPTSAFRMYLKSAYGILLGFPDIVEVPVSFDMFLKPIVLGTELNFAPLNISYEFYFRYYLGAFPESLFRRGWVIDSPKLDFFVKLKL